MTLGDRLLILLTIECIVIAIAYLFEKNIPKFIYFMGAVILNVGLLLTK